MADDLKTLRSELDELRNHLKPDELAKLLDRSYLSVSNLRVFLQILAVILTVFLAGAVFFGTMGLSNILDVRDARLEVEEARTEISEIHDAIRDRAKEINLDLESATQSLRKAEAELASRIGTLQSSIVERITTIDQETGDRIRSTEKELGTQVEQLRGSLAEANAELRAISAVFNELAVRYESEWNAREKRLLFYLARELEPANASFHFNAGASALAMGQYDEAVTSLEKVLDAKEVPENVHRRAKELLQIAKQRKRDPPGPPDVPSGAAIGGYSVLGLHIHTLETLRQEGLISLEQGQEIIDRSKLGE